MRIHAWILLALVALPSAQAEPQGTSYAAQIDEAVEAPLRRQREHISFRAEDGEFLRRIMLDLVGYPPNLEEVLEFTANRSPLKREKKIDELLATPRFADFWARRFASVFFGNYHEAAIEIAGERLPPETSQRIVRNFIAWLRDGIRLDRSWREISADLIRARGSTETVPELAYKASFYRTPVSPTDRQEVFFADGVSRHLLGISLFCARCHDHPFDRWQFQDYHGLSAFAVRQQVKRVVRSGKEELEFTFSESGEVTYPEWGAKGGVFFPRYLGKDAPREGDRTEWLATAIGQGPEFRRNFVNRVWGWLAGRGIIEPVDDINLKNKPVLPKVLAALGDAFDQGGGSLKFLIRSICLSETYQRSCEAEGACARREFCRGTVLPLSGEQLLHSIEVALRGAPGLDSAEAQALTDSIWRRMQTPSETEPLSCDLSHALLMRNGGLIAEGIRTGPGVAEIRQRGATERRRVELMFLAALSRMPRESERVRYETFLRGRKEDGIADAYWSLLNTTEFLTRH